MGETLVYSSFFSHLLRVLLFPAGDFSQFSCHNILEILRFSGKNLKGYISVVTSVVKLKYKFFRMFTISNYPIK